MSTQNTIKHKMKCEEVQQHLFAYLTHEISQNSSQLIKQHLSKCDNCQAEAEQIKKALDILKINADIKENIPTRLSEKRRELIIRSFMHPVLDFIYRHHIIISLIAALITIFSAFVVLWHLKIYFYDKPPAGIEVSIGNGD